MEPTNQIPVQRMQPPPSMQPPVMPPINRLPKRKNYFGVLMILLIIVVLGAIGYYMYESSMTSDETMDQSMMMNTQPTTHETAQQAPKDSLDSDIDSATAIDNSSDVNAINSEFKN